MGMTLAGSIAGKVVSRVAWLEIKYKVEGLLEFQSGRLLPLYSTLTKTSPGPSIGIRMS
jgi:hypothetical protein